MPVATCKKLKEGVCDHAAPLLRVTDNWPRMKIKRLPNVLALHLKRFKYQEDVQKYIKLTYRVAFPFELRLFNTVDDIPNPDRLYELFAIVVHIGKYAISYSCHRPILSDIAPLTRSAVRIMVTMSALSRPWALGSFLMTKPST